MVRALLFGSAIAALAGGCSKRSNAPSNAAAETPAAIQLGFLVKQPEEPWFQQEMKAAERAAAQFGFTVRTLGVPDAEKVMSAIDNLAAAGVQGFVICTPDVKLGPSIMARARRHGMKVVTVDDRFVGTDGGFMTEVPYLGMSASAIGRSVGRTLLAEMSSRGWKPEETGACIITFEQLDTARQRTDGAIEALKAGGFPADRIFKAPQKTTDIPGSFDAANALLTRRPEVKRWLIAGMNDNAVLGAVRAMESRGFGADAVIGIGINGTDCINELRKPEPTGFFGSMFVSAPEEGFRTTEMLYRWVKDGTKPPLDTRTEGTLITRENFEQVLREAGVLE